MTEIDEKVAREGVEFLKHLCQSILDPKEYGFDNIKDFETSAKMGLQRIDNILIRLDQEQYFREGYEKRENQLRQQIKYGGHK